MKKKTKKAGGGPPVARPKLDKVPAKPKKKKKKKLTIRQRKIIKGVIAGLSGKNAAKRAGHKGSDAALRNAASRVITNDYIQSSIRKAMRKAKIDDGFLTKVLKDGLKANSIRFFQRDGIVRDKRVCADHPTRKGFLDIAHKIEGNFAPEKIDLTDNREIKQIAAALEKLAK